MGGPLNWGRRGRGREEGLAKVFSCCACQGGLPTPFPLPIKFYTYLIFHIYIPRRSLIDYELETIGLVRFLYLHLFMELLNKAQFPQKL